MQQIAMDWHTGSCALAKSMVLPLAELLRDLHLVDPRLDAVTDGHINQLHVGACII